MRTVATGFFLGYLVVAFLIAPPLLWVLHMTPDYVSGVVLVLDRSGVLKTAEQTARRVVELRDRMNQELAEEIDRLVFKRPGN